MLDMIELYGLDMESGDYWRDVPSGYDWRERIHCLLKYGKVLKPSTGHELKAGVLQANYADERFRIGRWCGRGNPQFIDWELKSDDGLFALRLADCEMAVFLLPPLDVDLAEASLSLQDGSVALNNPRFAYVPLYY